MKKFKNYPYYLNNSIIFRNKTASQDLKQRNYTKKRYANLYN